MTTTRRDFLKLSGCLTIGFSIGRISQAHFSPVIQELPESLKRHPNINAWLEVLSDGNVRIFTGKAELGQGIRTAIAQVAAEELDLDVNKVEVILADTLRTPNEGYTVGSGSIEQSAMAVRYASAAAKMKLAQIAAKKLDVPAENILFDNGYTYTKFSTTRLSFAQLLEGKQITDEVTSPVTLKPRKDYRLVGKPIPRHDITNMVQAKHTYVQDLRFDGMVHARVVRPPVYGATLKRIGEQYVKKKVPGLIKAVVNGNFVSVIAADEYDAIKAQKTMQLSAVWTQSEIPAEGEHNLKALIEKLPVETERVEEKGKITSDTFTHTARYFKPYIMHGSIGPSCAVALWDQKTLHVWSHTQGVFPLRDALAQMLSLPQEKVQVTGFPGSGCYGHNGADDVAADAAITAMAYPGKHIRLQWSREDEHGWEPYGSAMIMQAAAKLDSNGMITDWKYDFWSDTHSTRPGGKAENLLAARYIEKSFNSSSKGYSGGASRNSQPYYAIPNLLVNANFFKGPLRVSALRSLGAYANIFAIESFMDELADKAGKDPYDFRMMHLKDERARAVLQRLHERIRNEKASESSGIGIAFSRYKNSAAYCAAAALVRVEEKGKMIRVEKMWAVVDAGEVINTDGLKNQTEGGMIQSASWTMKEQVKFNNRHISSTDWGTYPIFRFNEVPDVEVEILNQPEEEAMGAGEAAQGPAAAAIANALFRASGKRVRDLPVIVSE